MFVDPYLATVTIFGGTFAPQNWQFCNGALIGIANNTALFALIGTTYGGDGQTTFALPDLRGRSAVHPGSLSGNTVYLGEVSGLESVTLTTLNLPSHTHQASNITVGGIPSYSDAGTVGTPGGNAPSVLNQRYNSTSDSNMAVTNGTGVTGTAGSSTPVDMRSPYLAMNYIICTEGIFPSRN